MGLSVRAILPRDSEWVDCSTRDVDISNILRKWLAVPLSAAGVPVDASALAIMGLGILNDTKLEHVPGLST